MSIAADTDDRITARVRGAARRTIEEAADLTGATLNQFVVQAALEKAEKVIEKSRILFFSEEEAERLMELISAPPKPGKALRKAVKRHAEILRQH